MKKALVHLAVLTLATASLVHGADTPAAIAADYRAKAATALAKVNDTLEKATVPLVAALVKSGDTAGADLLKEQLKAKIAGEPVAMPQPTAVALFKSYDAARAKALEPAQQAAVKRIDAVLASSEGKKLDVVSELGKVRAEVEAGRSVSAVDRTPLSVAWSYHGSERGKAVGELTFTEDGRWQLKDLMTQKIGDSGTWSKIGDGAINLSIEGAVWKMTFNKKSGVIDRPDVGKRFLFAIGNMDL